MKNSNGIQPLRSVANPSMRSFGHCSSSQFKSAQHKKPSPFEGRLSEIIERAPECELRRPSQPQKYSWLKSNFCHWLGYSAVCNPKLRIRCPEIQLGTNPFSKCLIPYESSRPSLFLIGRIRILTPPSFLRLLSVSFPKKVPAYARVYSQAAPLIGLMLRSSFVIGH